MLRLVRMIMVSTLSTCGCLSRRSQVLLHAGGHYFDSLLFFFPSRNFFTYSFLFFETIDKSVFQCHKHTMLSGTQKETLALPWMLCIWAASIPINSSPIMFWSLQCCSNSNCVSWTMLVSLPHVYKSSSTVFPCVTRFSPWSIGCLTRFCVIGLAPPQESTNSWS